MMIVLIIDTDAGEGDAGQHLWPRTGHSTPGPEGGGECQCCDEK